MMRLLLSSFILLCPLLQALARARDYVELRNMVPNFEKPLNSSSGALKNIRIALIVVDYQNDFVTGSLAIGSGDAGEDPVARIENVNKLIGLNFDEVVITKDWHPYNHISFKDHAKDPDRTLTPEFASRDIEIFEKVTFLQNRKRIEQVLYPAHCVRNTHGAELVPQMIVPDRAHTVNKGVEVLVDSYSAFMDNEAESRSELKDYLKSKRIDAVVVCGLAYDICVFHTTKDARIEGFYAATVRDASASFSKLGARAAADYHQENLIPVMNTIDVEKMLATRSFPEEWYKIAKENANNNQ